MTTEGCGALSGYEGLGNRRCNANMMEHSFKDFVGHQMYVELGVESQVTYSYLLPH